ncbi:MAG: ankyrin repeat domain-containing protein [Spirochaetales bacterium]|nr:ankyrin repeat domain-containing protein [Spirochaetales bacterium]
MLKKVIFITVLFFHLAALHASDVNDELFQAVKNNNVRLVKKLINKLDDINILVDFTILDLYEGMGHSTKGTLLMWASYNGHVDIAKLVIEKGAYTDAADENGWTALMYACRMGHSKIVQLLITYGASVNVRDNYQSTALIFAAMKGDLKSVEVLIENSAFIDAQDNNDWTALMYSSYNHIDVVNYLLDKGSDLGIEGDNGWDALYVATVSGNYEIVKLLLERGAALNKKYECVNCGQTLLIVAAERGYADIVKLLIQKGCLVNMRDDWGYTALDWAERQKHEEIANLLKKAGAKKGSEIK